VKANETFDSQTLPTGGRLHRRSLSRIYDRKKWGYKVPASIADVVQFVERTDSLVVPMLRRVDNARDAIKDLTGGFEILSDERFAALREALDGRVFGQALWAEAQISSAPC
jgi:hypothetical protein